MSRRTVIVHVELVLDLPRPPYNYGGMQGEEPTNTADALRQALVEEILKHTAGWQYLIAMELQSSVNEHD